MGEFGATATGSASVVAAMGQYWSPVKLTPEGATAVADGPVGVGMTAEAAGDGQPVIVLAGMPPCVANGQPFVFRSPR